MIRRIRNRRRTARRHEEMAAVVLASRDATVVAFGASTDAAVMGHLLNAMDELDKALRILAPSFPAAELFAIPGSSKGPNQ